MASTILSDNGVSSGSVGLKSTADSTGVLALQTTTAGGAATTAVTIGTNQYIGVGTTSTSYPLQIGTNPSASSSPMLALNPATGTNGAILYFNNSGSGGLNIGRSDSAGAGSGTTITAYDSFVATTGTTGLSFHTNNTRAMYIDSGQNVGIGTNSPTNRFNVKGASGAGEARLDGNSAGAVYTSNGDVQIYTNNSAYSVRFLTATGAAESARFDNSGNLLVGGTTAGAKVRIETNLAPQDGLDIKNTVNNTGNTFVGFYNYNSVIAGSISQPTATTVLYNTTSDYRLKENIAPMTGALEKVLLLKPCTYTWKDGGQNWNGFIAHEVAEIVPQCVTGVKDAVNEEGKPVYQSIDTSFLVATLTAAIQEQQATINALTARVASLEAK